MAQQVLCSSLILDGQEIGSNPYHITMLSYKWKLLLITKDTTNPPKHPPLCTLNDIIIEDINDEQTDRQKQSYLYRNSIATFRTSHSNFDPVDYSSKLVGHTTVNTPPQMKTNNQVV